MDEKKFVALISRLEVYARQNPGAYKLRVGLLAALGYFVLFGTLAAVLLLVGACVYFGIGNLALLKFLFVPIAIAAVVLRSLWVEFPKPEGYRLRPSDAPRLFELVSRIRTATKGPKVHKILLTDELNAAILQRPRLGMFGWYENYLIIGLPLLHGLSPDEVRAVIAHEFGHLSGKHSAFSGWIYRVRQTWFQVLSNAEKHRRHAGDFLQRIFNWYVPYFSAYSFVLARATEFEADRCSVVLSGRQNAARALINVELKQRALHEEHWPEFYRGADTQAEPPEAVFSSMLEALRRPLTPDKAQMWFAQSLTQRHDYADTHPALGDRLEAIGYPHVRQIAELEEFVKNGHQRADEYFLQNVLDGFIAEKNRSWRESVGMIWSERHKFVADAGKRLAELEEKSKSEDLPVVERWERGHLVAQTRGKIEALPLLLDVVALEPDHAAANYTIGEALLKQDDEAGIAYIERAVARDLHATTAGCGLIFEFLAGHKRTDEAESYRRRAQEYEAELQLAREERCNISKKDDFKAHGMTPDAVVAMRAELGRLPNLASAHLVQKVVRHFPQDPSFVLGIVRKRTWRNQGDARKDQELVDQVAENVTFPGYGYIIALEQDYKPLRKIFKLIPGSEIYRR
jgi:Zn-dependent protease with chaperone function